MNARFGDLGKRFTTQNQCGMMERPAGASHLPDRPNQNGSRKDHVMAAKPLPSPEVLRQLLRYEPDTGKLFWKERPDSFCKSPSEARRWNKRFSGKEITVTTTHGYRAVTIFDRQYPAHRICYAIFHGAHPGKDIDHINGDRADNRIENLRAVSPRQNAVNRKKISRNVTGVCGVSKTQYGTFTAYVSTGSRRIYLGSFKSLEDAALARKSAERRYNYSATHGRDA